METLAQQIANKCVHFNGIMNKACKKGILYEDVRDQLQKPYKFPCLKGEIHNGGNCEFCEFPSMEEAQKQEAELLSKAEKMFMAYALVKSHVNSTRELSGKIECPECKGELHYRVAELNGHIWAKCNGCDVSWME